MINNIEDNMNNTNMKNDIQPSIQKNKVLHPCPNCEKMCYGKQCTECHFNMMEKNKGTCADCACSFQAQRKDGSMRKRCKDCQTSYNEKHIAICKICSQTYHALLDDGRSFDRCYTCYQESINNKCEACGNKAFGQKFCKPCYELEKTKKMQNMQLVKCRNKSCNNETTFTYCRDCNRSNRETADSYMISSCYNCGRRYKGNSKFCVDCK